MMFLWVLCLPIAVVMLAAAIEWANARQGQRRAHGGQIHHGPARVLVFDVMRARACASQGSARGSTFAGSAELVMLHEARRRSSRSIPEGVWRTNR